MLFLFPWKEGKLYRTGFGTSVYMGEYFVFGVRPVHFNFFTMRNLHLDCLRVIPPIVGDGLICLCETEGGRVNFLEIMTFEFVETISTFTPLSCFIHYILVLTTYMCLRCCAHPHTTDKENLGFIT